MEGFFFCTPSPTGHSSFASYFASKIMASTTPHPLGISDDLPLGGYGFCSRTCAWDLSRTHGWFGRYVIAAMLVDEDNRSLISSFCSSTSIRGFTIVICVSRDWLQTTYSFKRHVLRAILLETNGEN